MSNPLSPLSPSFQNARGLSPKPTSSPFLHKTIDEPSSTAIPSSPLKKPWTHHDEMPNSYDNENFKLNDQNENDEINDGDSFQEGASSPFRPDGREDTVDFQKLRELQQASPEPVRPSEPLNFEEPASSPFCPDGREDTVDFQKLQEVQRMSPDLGKRLAVEEPASSPFRPNGRDDTVSFQQLHNLQPGSPGLDKQPLGEPESSPFQADAKDETVDFQALRDIQRESLGFTKPPSPVAFGPPFQRDDKEDTLDLHKVRQAPRASLEVDGRLSVAATPRKRSYDQTPQDQGESEQMNERCKKGMVSRTEGPEIHVDLEESSIIHNQSMASTTSATQDRSTIANSVMEDKRNEGMSTVLHEDGDSGLADKENLCHPGADENSMLDDDMHDSKDDTCLSTFSALPDMTSFAKLRAESPLKAMRSSVAPSPTLGTDMRQRSIDPATPSTARRLYRASALLDYNSQAGSPTPRRRGSRDAGHPSETPNLLDFTDQVNFFPRASMQQSARYSPSRRSPLRAVRQSLRSPSKLSLLDFDIPPAPTPRSIPTITPRELESLKSGFSSEISSLKAALSGKEAEVGSLKKAVADAERRVGEALEEVRNEAARKETLEIEQAEWERRGKDMESVLRSVRAELVEGEQERDRLAKKAEEAEKSKEQLEGKIVELEIQLTAARTSGSAPVDESHPVSKPAEETAREVQDAVEKVARELHTLYKGKHETKVAALKKSYEARWGKRLREAENKVTAAHEENERLKAERDTAHSESMAAANTSLIAREHDEHETQKRVLEAQIKGLQQEMAAIKEDSERLRGELKSERTEKGELVAAVDEWLAIQQSQPAPAQHDREPSVSSSAQLDENDRPLSIEPISEDLHRNIAHSGSGAPRAPATAEKRIPRYGVPGGHPRGNSGGKSGIAVFTPGRGGIMSSIERMGRGGA
ncbi:hypothetical protein NUU61_007077 [Penicillium alfredii]|uniref:Central kinetochore-associated n=1 Tax=Penicillium alfredii TaxID=1506179 RepID=A0A9W9K4V6_9EURO|nr:uncharacterized protein NUU61_007077 [Penicillium alfredii]KAJ5092207.1 hypothetical protein NUU61_007077 [Penicillium alfredii]